MKRWSLVLLLLLLLLTVAPRTSWNLGDGWRADILAEQLGAPTGGGNTIALKLIPPGTAWTQKSLNFTFVGTATWELVTATAGCYRYANTISCPVTNTGELRVQQYRVTVRTLEAGTLDYSLSLDQPI
jgi:hypothetical protein